MHTSDPEGGPERKIFTTLLLTLLINTVRVLPMTGAPHRRGRVAKWLLESADSAVRIDRTRSGTGFYHMSHRFL